MACVVSIQEGVHGLVKAGIEGDSLFLFRQVYFDSALALLHSPMQLEIGAEADIDVLVMAAEALVAEHAALQLLERAEQSRFGLSHKLAKRKIDRRAIAASLDFLENSGLLSDTRFASSWIRQRVRRHAEGPGTLRQALLSRGIPSHAIAAALEETLSGSARCTVLETARTVLSAKYTEARDLRYALKGLGYGSAEIDECISSGDDT